MKTQVETRPMAQRLFNVRYGCPNGKDVPYIQIAELVAALGVKHFRRKSVMRMVSNAVPNKDFRPLPCGSTPPGVLYVTASNALCVLRGIAPSLKGDANALARIPVVIMAVEALS